MDEITFTKENDGEENSLSCQDCYFDEVCNKTGEPLFDCQLGDYWVLWRSN
ncbi:MAG: hypothetical protein GY799_21190 [Desulfobulbaceae bacterium]|nr:hypothetical protein [Desulfobulbaceae bacterium]